MWRGDFVVDPEAGATMQQVLQTVGGPQPKGDDRGAAQFRADALFDVFRLAGKHAPSKPGVRKPRADFTAVLTLDEIERRDPKVAMAIRQSPHGLSRGDARPAHLRLSDHPGDHRRTITSARRGPHHPGVARRVTRRAMRTPRRWLHHPRLHPRSRMVRHPPRHTLGRRRRNQRRQRPLQMPPPPHQRTRSQPRAALTIVGCRKRLIELGSEYNSTTCGEAGRELRLHPDSTRGSVQVEA